MMMKDLTGKRCPGEPVSLPHELSSLPSSMHRDQCKCSIALPQRFPVLLHLVSPEDAPCKAFMILWHFSSLFALVSKPMFRDYVVGFRKLAAWQGRGHNCISGEWALASLLAQFVATAALSH
jgi:hypothetical protein